MVAQAGRSNCQVVGAPRQADTHSLGAITHHAYSCRFKRLWRKQRLQWQVLRVLTKQAMRVGRVGAERRVQLAQSDGHGLRVSSGQVATGPGHLGALQFSLRQNKEG